MAFTNIADFVLDQILAYQDMNELKYNILAVKEFPKCVIFGGYEYQSYTNTVATELVRQIYNEIDGTNVQGCTYELHFMGQSPSGSTISVRLVNVTDASTVVTKTFTSSTLGLQKSASFTLPTGTKLYRVDVFGASGHPFGVYGARVIQR